MVAAGRSRKNREKTEKLIRDNCTEVLDLLDKSLIVRASVTESKVFYLKMKADFTGYLSEVYHGDEREGKDLTELADP